MNKPGCRFSSVRFGAILCILRNGDPVTCSDLAGHFNCTTKTIWRDIQALRAEGHLISFDFSANTFRLAEPEYHI